MLIVPLQSLAPPDSVIFSTCHAIWRVDVVKIPFFSTHTYILLWSEPLLSLVNYKEEGT